MKGFFMPNSVGEEWDEDSFPPYAERPEHASVEISGAGQSIAPTRPPRHRASAGCGADGFRELEDEEDGEETWGEFLQQPGVAIICTATLTIVILFTIWLLC